MLRNPETQEVVRTGRSNDLLRRAGEHRRDKELKVFLFRVDKRTDSYQQQRGREQIIHDVYKAPFDKINAISPSNPNFKLYLDAASNM